MSKFSESAVWQAAAVWACLLMTGGFAAGQVGGDDPAAIGSWELLDDQTEIMVVHAALLPTGKVLMFSGELEGGLPHLSVLWDPLTNEQTIQGPIVEDIFCAGHSHLADGRLLTIGGDGPVRTQTYVFDPWAESWTQLSDMENGRWYPTAVTLGDGRVVVFSGWSNTGNPDEVEIWDPATEEWTTYPPSSNRDLELYPGMHLMPNGKIFYSGTRWNGGQGWGGANSAYFDPTTGEWQELGPHVNGDRSEAISVLLPELEAGAEPWRVMVAGGWAGGESQQNSAEIINLADANPQWVNITPMNFRRNNLNAAILPDGDVAMVSGIGGWKWGPFDATFTTEHFDPVTETWQAMASMQVGAQYHSIGLLLPDGRVLKTGGHMGPGVNIRDMEVYSPAYLFNGPRPIIDAAPAEVGWAQEFSITTPNAPDVTLVSLVKLGHITHHTNPDQRFLSLNFEQPGEDLLTITSPAHGNIAPPGYYMLFILNDCGVPSIAEFLKLGDSKPGTTTPFDVDVFRGFQVSGNLNSLQASDDNRLCYNPGIVLNPTEAPITLDFLGSLPNDSPSTLDVTIESSANTVGLELTISFWNFNTSSWDIVGGEGQSLNADTVRTFPGIPADHVEAGTGEVRSRYEVRQVGLIFIFPWTDCVDHVFWTTTN